MQYPLYEGDIRLEHPEIREDQTYPNFPCPDTFALVLVDPMPVFDSETHITNPLSPENINGKWVVKWAPVRELTASEKQTRENLRILQAAERIKNSSNLFNNLNAPGEMPNVL
jgi:hypothetical protein